MTEDSLKEQHKRRQSIYIMKTPATDCDICKAESIQRHLDGSVTGESTLTIMHGMGRVLTLCYDCWHAVDARRKFPTKW